MDSILNTIKSTLSIEPECEDFDQELILHINSVFSVLTQLGVGPEEGFFITDSSEKWSDFTEDMKRIQMLKTYIGLKVRLLFDPPTTSFAIESIKNAATEYEWRLNVECDKPKPIVGDIEEVTKEEETPDE